MIKHARFLLGCAAMTAVLFAAGCGSGSKPAAVKPTTTSAPMVTGTTANNAAAVITIHDFMFGSAITVKAGSTVTVKNADTTTHTVAADNGSFDTGNIFAGSSASFSVPKAGTYKFHCNIHANMHGTLIVVAS